MTLFLMSSSFGGWLVARLGAGRQQGQVNSRRKTERGCEMPAVLHRNDQGQVRRLDERGGEGTTSRELIRKDQAEKEAARHTPIRCSPPRCPSLRTGPRATPAPT